MLQAPPVPGPTACLSDRVLSEGITIQQSYGKITGRLMFKIKEVEMPWMESEEQALRVHAVLVNADLTGYYDPAVHK